MENGELQDMIIAVEKLFENHKGQKLQLVDISNLRKILRLSHETEITELSLDELIAKYDLKEITIQNFIKEIKRRQNDNTKTFKN